MMVSMFRTFWQYGKEKKWLLLVAPILVMGQVIAELQQPNLLAKIINVYNAGGDKAIIWTIGWQMVGYLFFSVITFLVSVYAANLVAAYFGKNLRQDLFKKVQSLSLAQIEELTPGALLTRLTNDVNQAQNLLVQILRLAIRAPLMFLGSLFFLARINFQLLGIVLLLTPFILIAVVIITKLALPLFRKLQKTLDRLNNQMSESLNGIRTVKSFNREQLEIDKFATINDEFSLLETRGAQIMALAMPLMMFILNLAVALVLWQGAQLLQLKEIEIGSLIAAIGYLSQLLFSFLMISFVFISIMRTKVSIERIVAIIKMKSNLKETKEKIKLFIKKGAIEFRKVNFAYKKESEPIFEDFNLKINAGESVGFIGATGSGKTTLALLLNRLYDPTSGEILIDDVNLKNYALDEIKQKVALVLQEAILLSGTIEDNLVWGDKVTDDKIAQALKISQAETFVSQNERTLQAEVTRRGSNFSGGQKQRLSLARALARDFKILILDDTTSALDLKTAALVQKALQEKVKLATKIMISQRIASVRKCDKIVVIDQGKVHGIGTHEELIKTDEIYQEINRIQEEES